jgi:hypothetical protein
VAIPADLRYNFPGAERVDDGSMTAVDNQYFSRAATWSRLDERLVVHDTFSPQAPRMITMEPWHEVVFLSADGEHTIDEFVRHMGSQYEGAPPAGLREQIHEIVQVLVAEGILRIHDHPAPLPPDFAEEFSSQPPEVRKAQMEADGLLGDAPQA